MFDRCGSSNRKVDAVGEISSPVEVWWQERQREHVGEEVYHQAAIGIPVGGVAKEGGTIGRRGDVSKGVWTCGRVGVAGVGEGVSKGIDL